MEPIAPILYSLFRGSPRHAEWVVACLQGAWPGLMGAKLSTVCQPRAYDEGRLDVEVLDQSWSGALESCKAELLEKIQAATGGEVRSLSLKPAAS